MILYTLYLYMALPFLGASHIYLTRRINNGLVDIDRGDGRDSILYRSKKIMPDEQYNQFDSFDAKWSEAYKEETMLEKFKSRFGEGTAFDLDWGKLLIIALLIYVAVQVS